MECRHGNFWIGLGMVLSLVLLFIVFHVQQKLNNWKVKFMTLSTALVVMLRWQQLVQRRKQ